MSSSQNWLTVREVAGELQVHEETVRRWIRSGELAALELGGPRTMYRIRPADLGAFMRQHTRTTIDERDRQPAPPATARPTDFRHLVEQLRLVTFVYDPNDNGGRGSLLYISPEVEQVLGVPPHEWYQDIGSVWPSLMSPEQFQWLAELAAQLRITNEHFSVDVRMVNRATGAPVWVRIDLEVDSPVPGEELWYGLMVDITHRKVVEERLRTHVRILDELATRLGPVMSLERMTFEVIRDLHEAVPASRTRFRLIGAGRKNLTSYAIDLKLNGQATDLDPSAMEVSRTDLTRNLLAYHVLSTEKSMNVSDLRREARFSGERELLEAGARSALAVPVRDQARIIAVLEVAGESQDAFGEGDKIFLEAAGSIAGLALARQGERWLTVPDVAEMMEVRPETVRRWIRSGDLVAAMPGGVRAGYRIESAQLESFVLQRQADG